MQRWGRTSPATGTKGCVCAFSLLSLAFGVHSANVYNYLEKNTPFALRAGYGLVMMKPEAE